MTQTTRLTISSCSILKDPIEINFATDQSYFSSYFTPKEAKVFQNLFHLVQTEPRQALEKLSDFAAEHPQVPMVSNLQAFCYIQLKDVVNAEKVVEEAFSQFPDYLFAQVNYADLLMRRKQWRKVPAIFEGKLDLSEWKPDRKTFHYAEVRGFMTMLGHYYHDIGKRKLALEAFRIAVQTDPSHPSVATLEKKLFYQPFFRIIKFFLRKIFHRI